MPRHFSKPPRLPIITQSQPLYFVTFCTMHRRRLLANDVVHDAFRHYAEAGLEHGVGVGQYVLMPEHAHLFVRMSGGTTLGRWIGGLKRAMGKAMSPVVTAVPAVVSREEQDAAGTAATTERERGAPVITGACPSEPLRRRVSAVETREAQDAAGTAATTEEGAAAPVVTAVPAVPVTREDKDAADTAATTAEGTEATTGIQPFDVSRNLWQPGFFDHLLRHDESYAEKWLYVRDNPVRKHLVEKWDAWPYRGEIVVIDRA